MKIDFSESVWKKKKKRRRGSYLDAERYRGSVGGD
jgi:hypothetical protein